MQDQITQANIHTQSYIYEQCLESNGHPHPLLCPLLRFSSLVLTAHMRYLNSHFLQTI